jgi:phosphoglucomutase
MERHWARFGRHFYSRYDYEAVDSAAAERVFEQLRTNFVALAESAEQGEMHPSTVRVSAVYTRQQTGGLFISGLKCIDIEEFFYVDPKDKTFASNQGIILKFSDGERAIFRLSGTGSEGATIRIYLEAFEDRPERQSQATSVALASVAKAALHASRIVEITGRNSPSVIT